MQAALKMIQAGSVVVRAGGAGVFIDNSALAHGGQQWLDITEDEGPDALSFALSQMEMSMSFFRLPLSFATVVLFALVSVETRAEKPRPRKDPITPGMRKALGQINQIHTRMDQKRIDDAVEALHKEIGIQDPKVFVPLAIDHLLRLAPKDTRTRILLRRALARGWLEEQMARAFLVQAGDTPGPHIKQLMKDMESNNAKIRARAMVALGACGKAGPRHFPNCGR